MLNKGDMAIINKHTGKLHISNRNIELKTDSGKIINQQNIADTLKSFHSDCI